MVIPFIYWLPYRNYISIEYREDVLLQRMIVTPLETHRKFWGKNVKRSSITNKNGFVNRILIIWI